MRRVGHVGQTAQIIVREVPLGSGHGHEHPEKLGIVIGVEQKVVNALGLADRDVVIALGDSVEAQSVLESLHVAGDEC
jgi:hypothetical protein